MTARQKRAWAFSRHWRFANRIIRMLSYRQQSMRIWAFCIGLPSGLRQTFGWHSGVRQTFGWQQFENTRDSAGWKWWPKIEFAALDLSLRIPFKLFFSQLTTRNDGKTKAWSRLSVYKTDKNLQFETLTLHSAPLACFFWPRMVWNERAFLFFGRVPFCDHLDNCLPIFSLCSCLILWNVAGATLLLNFAHVCQRTECCSPQNQRQNYRPGSLNHEARKTESMQSDREQQQFCLTSASEAQVQLNWQ